MEQFNVPLGKTFIFHDKELTTLASKFQDTWATIHQIVKVHKILMRSGILKEYLGWKTKKKKEKKEK